VLKRLERTYTLNLGREKSWSLKIKDSELIRKHQRRQFKRNTEEILLSRHVSDFDGVLNFSGWHTPGHNPHKYVCILHYALPNDPDSGDPQSIPIDNYTGSSRRKNMGSEDIPVTSPIIT
jgi:hypothetical protein